jgi:hypothetical protein
VSGAVTPAIMIAIAAITVLVAKFVLVEKRIVLGERRLTQGLVRGQVLEVMSSEMAS